MSAISKSISQIKASIIAHKWIWAGSSVVVLAAVVLASLYFTGFFGPSGRAICKVAVDRAKSYGTLPSSATQNGSAQSTDIQGRKTCQVDSDADKYVVTVDLKCNDLKNADCLPIYSVERADGLSLYQTRAVPNDADDAGAAPTNGGATADNGTAPTNAPAAVPGGTTGVEDADVEVAHPAEDGTPQQ